MHRNLVPAPFRADIQILRAIAVTAVVLFHANESVFPQGFLGVDVFFVISGFVVTPLIIRVFPDSPSPLREVIGRLRIFYIRRLLRLAPSFGLMLTFSVPLMLIFASVSELSRFANQGLASLVLLGNLGAYFFSGSNYFAPNPNPLIHLWSLSAEEQIYLVLPAILVLAFLGMRRWKFGSPEIVIMILGINAFTLDILSEIFPSFLQSFGVANPESLMFYLPITRFWEFAFGSLLFFSPSEKRSNSRLSITIGSISLIVLLLLLFGNHELSNPLTLPLSLSVSFLTTLVILFKPLCMIPHFMQQLGSRVGDWSYPIYLFHMPLIYVARYSPVFGDRDRRGGIILAVLLSYISGFMSTKYFEAQFRRPQRDFLKYAKTKMRRLVIILIVPAISLITIVIAADSRYWGKDPNGIGPKIASLQCDLIKTEVDCVNQALAPRGEALLIGDSHAQALSIAFKVAMSELNLTSYIHTKPGCQFITRESADSKVTKMLGFNKNLYGDDVSNTCFQHNEHVRKWVSSHSSAIVFISNRSSSFLPEGITASMYNEALLKSARSLITGRNRIVLIGPNPEFPDDGQFFTGNLAIWQNPYLPYESILRSKMKSQSFQDDNFFVTKTSSGTIQYMSSIDVFCTDRVCNRKDGARWLYAAKGHLSVDGANKFIPHLIDAITKR